MPAPPASFNSRAREGRDVMSRSGSPPRPVFQFTRPRGARRFFEPGFVNRLAVSIHAPARGATSRRPARWRAFPVSIHAPARGATWDCTTGACTLTRFQFTRPRGARRPLSGRRKERDSFNSRAREGRDPHSRVGLRVALVSIHAPARGATTAA